MNWIEHYIEEARSKAMRGEGYWWRALYNFWTGRIDQSLTELYQLKGFAEDFAGDYSKAALDWTLAWFYYDKGDFENSYRIFRARTDFIKKKNLPINSKNEAYFHLGLVDLGVGRIDSAASKLAKFRLDDYRTYTGLWYSIFYSEVLLAQDSLERAISFRNTIVPVTPNIGSMDNMANYNVPFLKDVFARVYYKKGDIDKAIAEYERLITFDPQSQQRFLIHPKYHYRLAKLYEEKGKKEKAISEYKIFLNIWKDADKDLPELIDAQKRLARLKMTRV
jgi:tetratricopeptide (TPR) repeat protein